MRLHFGVLHFPYCFCNGNWSNVCCSPSTSNVLNNWYYRLPYVNVVLVVWLFAPILSPDHNLYLNGTEDSFLFFWLGSADPRIRVLHAVPPPASVATHVCAHSVSSDAGFCDGSHGLPNGMPCRSLWRSYQGLSQSISSSAFSCSAGLMDKWVYVSCEL